MPTTQKIVNGIPQNQRYISPKPNKLPKLWIYTPLKNIKPPVQPACMKSLVTALRPRRSSNAIKNWSRIVNSTSPKLKLDIIKSLELLLVDINTD